MSKIEELLKNEKVEWKKLWEVTIWDKKFKGVDKHKLMKINKFHCYQANILESLASETGTVKILTTNKSNIFADENKELKIYEDEIICIPSGGNAIIQYFNGRFITADNRIATTYDPNKLSIKFLYYFLVKKIDLIASYYRGAGIKHPDMAKILEIDVPLPSLKTQEKIVKILDNFTNYVTELQAELQARAKQYEYYRDLLLSEAYLNKLNLEEGGGQAELRLKDACQIKRGRVISKTYLEQHNGKYPVYSSQTLNNGEIGKIDTYDYDGEFATWTTDGAYAGTVFYRNGKFSTTNICGVISPKNSSKLLVKFLTYFLQTVTKEYVNDGSGNPKLMSNVISEIKIIIPITKIQEKIINILDKFGYLVDETEGLLSKEIKQRQKQYEYYREKLLTFK